MSTAHATITFHRVAPDREATILAALRIRGFRFEYVDTITAPLRLFRTYGVRDADTLICDTFATLIRRLDRTAVFTICQDPNHEFVGQMLTSDPDLGDFCAAADEEANPLVPVTEMRRAVAAARLAVTAGAEAATAFTELDRLTGGPWWRRIDELRTPASPSTDTTDTDTDTATTATTTAA